MKILLVNPSQYELYGGLQAPDHPPMGLAYVGAVLEKEGHEVKIIDIDADGITEEEFKGMIRTSGFGMVGVTALTPSFHKAVEITRVVKANSDAWTVLGGIHPTIMPELSLEPESVDFIVKGEGEMTVNELVDRLENGKCLSDVDGIGYKVSGRNVINRDRDLIKDLDDLPFPAMHLFKNRSYTYPDALYSPTLPIITSRGCPGSCTYCNTKNIFTKKFRARTAENVVDEFQHLVEDFGVREIHIWDDNFTTLKQRVLEVRDEVKKRGLKIKFAFPNGLRIDFIDEDILRALKDMGTYSIAVGIESGSQKILDVIKKGITIEKIRERFAMIKKVRLESWGFFMIGLPEETPETIMETIRFAIDLDPDIAKFHILKPFPGTEVFEQLSRKGLITSTDFDLYGIHTRPAHRLEHLSEDDLLEWQNKAYKMFYLRPGKMISQILRMSTWNRIKLNTVTGFTLLKKMLNVR
jgi:anaerobic magnesium-protoporphyrin IX monomethyl ester cyclase